MTSFKSRRLRERPEVFPRDIAPHLVNGPGEASFQIALGFAAVQKAQQKELAVSRTFPRELGQHRRAVRRRLKRDLPTQEWPRIMSAFITGC
jgi:hypothetical protein